MMQSEWAADPSVESWREASAAAIKRQYGGTVEHMCLTGIDGAWGCTPTCPKKTSNGSADYVTLPPLVDREFEEAVDSILAELRATMLKKQADYGPKNIASAPGGPINGLRVRMFDKLARISNLHESGVAPENESIQDSFLDIGNYGIIGLMVLRGQWPGTSE